MRDAPVRTGFIIDTLAPGAGTENQLLWLLGALDRSRVAPRLVCLTTPPAPDALPPSLPVHILGIRRMLSPSGVRGLRRWRRLIADERLEVVVTFFRDANIVGTAGAWRTGAAVVSSRRSLGGGYWHTPNELRILRALNRRTALWAANSEAVRRYTAEAEGVPADRIRVLPNAVDVERFRPPIAGEREAVRRALGLAVDERVVGCVANLRPVKGLDRLLEAFRIAREAEPRARLVLVGDGPLRASLAAEAERLGIAAAVTFLGARADVPELLRAFDLLTLTSQGEGSSNALLEGAATGLPLVATDVGGNRDLLSAARCGELVPFGDVEALGGALARGLADGDEAARRGRAARAVAEERHAPSAVLERWVALLEEARDGAAQWGMRSV